MSSLREIKDRIGSVRSTLKITSAMKLVASAKLRKAQRAIEGIRPYEEALADIMMSVAGQDSSAEELRFAHPSQPSGWAPPAYVAAGGHGSPQTNPATGPDIMESSPAHIATVPGDAGASVAEAAGGHGSPQACPAADGPDAAGKIAVVAVSSNSSLCGGFNSNVIRKTMEVVAGCGGRADVYAVGRKMAEAMKKVGCLCGEDYSDMIGHPSFDKSAGLARMLTEKFAGGEYSAVVLVYNKFVSTSSQVPVCETFLPFSDSGFSGDGDCGYIVEPGRKEVLEEVMPQLQNLRFHAAILDSAAAEQAARTVAMQAASDNAESLLGELTLEYNKGRQQKITAEILDLLGGAAG